MRRINTKKDLKALARQLQVRPDWHEPDEQDVTAEVHGTDFDNAGFWPEEYASGHAEMHVIISQGGKPVAAVNLATLFSWAAE